MANPIRKMSDKLTGRIPSLAGEGQRNLSELLILLSEIPEHGEESTTSPAVKTRKLTKVQSEKRAGKIKSALGVLAFLFLYMLAGSVAPVHSTPYGTIAPPN